MAKTNHILFLEGLQKVLGKVQEQSPGLVLIYGPCEYFAHKALNAIKTVWKEKTSSSSFAWDFDELKKNSFVELCEQRNLFEKASLHIIRKVKKQSDLASWISSLSFAPQNLIVVTIDSDKVTQKLSDCAEKYDALSIPCQSPFKSELSGIAQQLLKKRKVHLSPEALKDLLNSVGEDLYTLENEIERISLIFTDEKPVNAAQLKPYLNSLSEEQSFKLVNLLLEHKHAQAQMFISELLRQGESPIAVSGLIAWHCRNTLKMFESATRTDKRTPSLRLSYTLLKSYQQYMRSVKPLEIINALLACQSVDTALKSTARSPEDLLYTPLLYLSEKVPRLSYKN